MPEVFTTEMTVNQSLRTLVFGAAISLACLPVLAQDFPTLAPKLQLQMNAAAAQFNAAKANIEQWFSWPTGASAPVPCEGALIDLHRLGGVIPSDDPQMQKQLNRIMKKEGLLPGSLKPPEFKVNRLHILKAQCKNGKLDGEVEAWMDYEEIRDNPLGTDSSQYRVHYTSQFRADVLAHENRTQLARWLFDKKITHKDPATQQWVAKAKRPVFKIATFTSLSALGSVAVMHMTLDGKSSLNTVVSEYLALTPKMRATMLTYQRSQLVAEGGLLDGELHGWMIGHPHTDTLHGFAIPGHKTCYEEGELIKSNTCEAN